MQTLTTLIDPATLAAHLADPGLVVIDCRFALDDVTLGERQFAERHIPGAVYAHLDRDLSGPRSGTNGRHPLPDPGVLATTFGRLGIGTGVQVVAYDQDSGIFASRLWWLLRWLGHDAVAVLDGGLAAWLAEGYPTSASQTAEDVRRTQTFIGRPRPGFLADADEVARRLGQSEWRLLDARAPERFRGDSEPLDRAAGHIPGAANYFYKGNLDERGRFREAAELRARLAGATRGVAADHVIAYCGSGVTACHNLLALEHAGLHGARLYVGSWSEWSSDPTRPTAKGEA
jgi:thiosulfate/3-mercaptopyruvate sulfurtransferase